MHCYAFSSTRGSKPVSEQLEANCLQDLKIQFPQVFIELKFPIVRGDLVKFEYIIRLNDKAAAPPHWKVYLLKQDELFELEKVNNRNVKQKLDLAIGQLIQGTDPTC